MNLHTLRPVKGARKTRKRVGRGRASGLGKTSGRGHKGQYARSGHKYKPTFEGGQMPLVRRIPKRGFKNVNNITYLPVNVGALTAFEAGSEVGIEQLRAAGLASGPAGNPIKILGQGEVDRALTVKAHAFSASAKQKIEAAGGTCEAVK